MISNSDRELIDSLVTIINSRKLLIPALAFFETIEPMKGLFLSLGDVLAPFLLPFLNQTKYEKIIRLFSQESGFICFLNALKGKVDEV